MHDFERSFSRNFIRSSKGGMFSRRPSSCSVVRSSGVEYHNVTSAVLSGSPVSILILMMTRSEFSYDVLKASAVFFRIKNDGMFTEWPEPSSDITNTSESSTLLSPISAKFAPARSTLRTFVTNEQLPRSMRTTGSSKATWS